MRRTISRIGAIGAGAVLTLSLFAAGPPAGASSGHGAKAGKVEKAERGGRADKVEKVARATCLTTEGHTQGRSQSDPDGMSNGGPDKPGCTGGFDDDRDGNNGCGNDADREDDNNGRCGKAAKPDRTPPDTDVSPSVDGDDVTGCDVDGNDAEDQDANGCTDTDTDTDTDDGTVQATSAGTSDTGTPDTGTAATDTSVNGSSLTGTDVATDTADQSAVTPAAEIPTEVLGETLERSPGVLARTGAGIGGLALLGGLLCGGGRIALLARRFLRIG